MSRETSQQGLPAVAEMDESGHRGRSSIYVATQWQLMWWRFRKHKLAVISTVVVAPCST